MDSFLGWFGAEQMPPAIFMSYVLREAGLILGGVGVVIWITATDIVRYRPIVFALIALHMIAAPVFYVMYAIIGMPLWWRVMDFSCFFVAGGVPLAFYMCPSSDEPVAQQAICNEPGDDASIACHKPAAPGR
jgi:hypothetical protein